MSPKRSNNTKNGVVPVRQPRPIGTKNKDSPSLGLRGPNYISDRVRVGAIRLSFTLKTAQKVKGVT